MFSTVDKRHMGSHRTSRRMLTYIDKSAHRGKFMLRTFAV